MVFTLINILAVSFVLFTVSALALFIVRQTEKQKETEMSCGCAHGNPSLTLAQNPCYCGKF